MPVNQFLQYYLKTDEHSQAINVAQAISRYFVIKRYYVLIGSVTLWMLIFNTFVTRFLSVKTPNHILWQLVFRFTHFLHGLTRLMGINCVKKNGCFLYVQMQEFCMCWGCSPTSQSLLSIFKFHLKSNTTIYSWEWVELTKYIICLKSIHKYVVFIY